MFAELALDAKLIQALDKLGFKEPTPVQSAVIPAALASNDLLASAETGSGKTVAYLLPTLQQLLTRPAPNSGTRALILSPTRELARQVLKQVKQLCTFTALQADVITGGADVKYQRAALRKNPEIVIATPGRLLEHLQHSTADLNDLEVLIIDEADRMLDMGFADDVLAIVQKCNKHRQTLLLSATLSHKKIGAIATDILNNPHTINLSSAQDQHHNIHQQAILADNERHKDQLLNWLLTHEKFIKALVFTNTKTQASRLRGLLAYHSHRVGALHGDIEQDERNRMLDRLRRGQINILVATDVAARGLDVKDIDLVINYQLARSGDDYVHRIGRTGRAGATGLAIALIDAKEWNLKASIERYLKQQLELRTIKALEASYKGPKKVKASGKSAGGKKKKNDEKANITKTKQRARDQKNIGKRRTPKQGPKPVDLGDGFAPYKSPPVV